MADKFDRWSDAIDDLSRKSRNLKARVRLQKKKLAKTVDETERQRIENLLAALKSKLRVTEAVRFEVTFAPFSKMFGESEQRLLENET